MAILPGSRTQEITRNLPEMIRAAIKLAQKRQDVRFAVACLHERHKKLAEGIIADTLANAGAQPGLAIDVHAGRTPELIRLARVAWAVSGSVGLELMMEALPTVVLYKIKRFDLWVARWFIKAKYISLVNLLADAEVFPEYLTWRDVSNDLARWADAWLGDSVARLEATSALIKLRDVVAQPGASDRAAQHIAAWLSDRHASTLDGSVSRSLDLALSRSPRARSRNKIRTRYPVAKRKTRARDTHGASRTSRVVHTMLFLWSPFLSGRFSRPACQSVSATKFRIAEGPPSMDVKGLFRYFFESLAISNDVTPRASGAVSFCPGRARFRRAEVSHKLGELKKLDRVSPSQIRL